MLEITNIYSSTVQEGLLRFVGPYRIVSADNSLSGFFQSRTTFVISPSIQGSLMYFGSEIEGLDVNLTGEIKQPRDAVDYIADED